MADAYAYCGGCWWASTAENAPTACPLCGATVCIVPADRPPPRVVFLGKRTLVPFRWRCDLVETPEGVAMVLQLGRVKGITGPEHVRPTRLEAVQHARELVALLCGEQGYSLEFCVHNVSEPDSEVAIPKWEG